MKPRHTDLSTVHFARDQAAIQLPSESAQSIFYSSTGSLNHANLRRHLQPLTGQPLPSSSSSSPRIPGTSSNPPPRLVRQDAFFNEETPPLSDDTSIPAPIRRRCKVCFSMTEPLIKSPCQCWDPPSYIHQTCLIDTLSSTASSKHCSSCHSIYNVNMINTLRRPPSQQQRQQRPPPNGYYRGSLWKTIMIVAATTLIMETYRCTELQQIPGSELDDDGGGAAPDYIWLPVVQHQCWQESLLAMFWRSMKSYPFLASVSLMLLVVVICILDKMGY
ncbi:hypothetical protein O0I10_008034 [Lichtheimia ornata]|uniref:RING-CH-type domain-containing protein n=1 Tax=Lichtheimia ornata TaxID=688661 RepID=A0AAD7XVR2_9FUNG|nr:uncharacterized protein O0I10_008034 [Lichtheimia ornata]KAJ8656240.1 hypothetical protein O0I10_008034 [Lichtheimia ornata]